MPIDRDDISIYPMPVKQIVRDSDTAPEFRDYVANMVYVGILAEILKIEKDAILQALNYHFKGRSKPTELNYGIIIASSEWAAENLVKTDPYYAAPMDAAKGYIMSDGNSAAALGAVFGGVQFVAWYPITPATSLAESLVELLPHLRKDTVETGKNTYAVVQAEDELAAIGMAVGAGWSGLRSMTSSSGPGISLMAEYSGLAYFAEVPVVIWDVQRVGPSTGLPTRTAQGDLTFIQTLGHGDTKQIVLLPGSINECFDFGWQAFDIAERLQAPVFVLSDLDFGMNQWMAKPFEYPDRPMDRGKILWEEDLERLNGQWQRYEDVDGDGITYRTLPGNLHTKAGYFTRGTGHDENARYSEDSQEWHDLLLRLAKKFQTARQFVPTSIIENNSESKIGLISFGSTLSAVDEARNLLTADGLSTNFLRVRAIPITGEVDEFFESIERAYVVEMNRDGQLHQLLSLAYPKYVSKLRSIAYTDGLPLTARFVCDAVMSQEAK